VALEADRPPRRRFELVARGPERLDCRIAERMHIGGLEDELRLRRCRADEIGCQGTKGGKCAKTEQGTAIHGVLLNLVVALLLRGPDGTLCHALIKRCVRAMAC